MSGISADALSLGNSQEIHSPGQPDMSVFDKMLEGQGAPKGNQQQQPTKLAIDPKFAGLNPTEALLKTYQSRFDILTNQYNALASKYEDQTKVVTFFDTMQKNKDLLKAFVYKVDPNLLATHDIDSLVEAEMKKKYGDYQPAADEARTIGSKAYKYEKDYERIYNRFEKDLGTGGDVQTVEQVIASMQAVNKDKKEKVTKEIQEVQAEYGWDMNMIKKGLEWGQALGVKEIMKLFRIATNTPINVAGPGQLTGNISSPNEIEDYVTKTFGPPISGTALYKQQMGR